MRPAVCASEALQETSKKDTLGSVIMARASIKRLARDPYVGAIVIDAATGNVIFQDNADAPGYPASVVKLMNLLIILEAVEAGSISLEEKVTITRESEKMGGSQVYLKKGEVYTVNDLLYAMMVQSANDAATALALYYAGSKQLFVDRMNMRARTLRMDATVFHSVHGLPPGRGQMPDISTARDITKLSREILKHPDALRYTSTRQRLFREEPPFILMNRNHLVGSFEGCDGLKTGYFRAAGFSIAATASRGGKRVIAVVLGARRQKKRDDMARRLLSNGFTALASAPLPSRESLALRYMNP